MTDKTDEAHLDFMSKKEMSPIDRVTYMNDRISEAIESERTKIETVLDARRDALHKTLKVSKSETEKLMLMAHVNEISNIEEEIKRIENNG